MVIQQIYTYPLKSAAGNLLTSCVVADIGLEGDRRWMLIDPNGRFVTGRVVPSLVTLRAFVVADELQLVFADGAGMTASADLSAAPILVQIWKDTVAAAPVQPAVDDWLSARLGRPLRLVHLADPQARSLARKGIDGHVSFADGYPLLLTSRASLQELSTTVGRSLDMRRFRPNLVVDGSPPFVEDTWRRIRVGAVEFRVMNRCARCIFTTVDPDTGERTADREPLATLERERKFPEGACFGVNIVPALAGPGLPPEANRIASGDPLQVLE
jgi:hypothetical protein